MFLSLQRCSQYEHFIFDAKLPSFKLVNYD